MKARTRKEAIERGLRFYYTGVRCKGWFHAKRHGDQRYATTGRCTECAIRSEVSRRKKLPARVKSDAAKRQRRYYASNKAKLAVKNKLYRAMQLDFLNYVANGAPF